MLLKHVVSLDTTKEVKVFGSSIEGGIPKGNDWFQTIHTNLEEADAAYIVMTPDSVNRPWVQYEFGYLAGLSTPRLNATGEKVSRTVIPICFGLPPRLLPSFMSVLQIIDGDDRGSLISGMSQLAQRLGIDDPVEIERAVTSFHVETVGIRAEFRLQSGDLIDRLHDAGVTGIFYGPLQHCPEALRRCEQVQNQLVLVGPSLAKPLAANTHNSLRHWVSRTLANNRGVIVFIVNPALPLKGDDPLEPDYRTRLLKKIKNRDSGHDNTCLALTELASIRRETGSSADKLQVFLVDKQTLDFVMMVDDDWILCRSTIHWTRDARLQRIVDRTLNNDYKPPIIECRRPAHDNPRGSFFSDYSRFVEDLLVSANLKAALNPRAKDVARTLFKVTNVSAFIESVF